MASASDFGNQHKQSTEETFELPTEIWEQIFSHLSPNQLLTVRSSCRRWKAIVDQKQSLMEKLTFTFQGFKIGSLDNDFKLEFPDLPIRAAKLSWIDIVQIDAWWPSFGPLLTILNFSTCKVTLAGLVGMLRHTPNLVKMTLKSMEYTSLDCAASDLHLNRLEKLRVDEKSMFEALVLICPRLKRLYLDRSFSLDGENDPICCKLIQNNRFTLERLDFHLSDYEKQFLFGVNGAHAKTEPIFPNLKQLKMFIDEDSEEILIAPYLATMPLLEELDLHTPIAVEFNGLNVQNLKKLTLQDTYPCDLGSLITGAPNLRELHLEHGAVPWWGDVFDVVDKIPTLRCLEVSSPETLSYEPCLDNIQPNNLEVLSLEHCYRFDARLLNTFLKFSLKLKKLHLYGMDVDANTIKIIGRNLSKLEHIQIDFREACTEKDSAKLIVNNCLMLKKFKICNYKKFYEEFKKLVEDSKRNVIVEYEEIFDSS